MNAAVRIQLALVGLIVAAGVTIGTVASRAAQHGAGTPGQGGSIVVVGDSVAAGTNCDCTPFPELLRGSASTRAGSGVSLLNDAAGGATSADVLASLRDEDRAVVTALRHATIVVVTVGANDFDEGEAGSSACADSSCYAAQLTAMAQTMDQTLARITTLTGGRARVLVTGYWNVFLDGKVGAGHGPSYVATSQALTRQVNAALAAAALAHHALYVDIDAAFTARAGSDRTPLLASDGDHPNADGHRVIAAALASACGCA